MCKNDEKVRAAARGAPRDPEILPTSWIISMTRVLIIDPLVSNRTLLRQLLANDDSTRYQITEAFDPPDRLLAALQTAPPDCLLLGHHPPELDALALLETLRLFSDLPVILIIDHEHEATVAAAIRNTNHNYLIKSELRATRLDWAIERAVTAHHRAREHSQHAALLSAMLDTLTAGVVVLDADQRIVELNAALAHLLNRPIATLRGQPWLSLWPEIAPLLEQPCTQLLHGTPFGDLELYLPATEQQEARWLSFIGALLHQSGRVETLGLIIVRDITPRKLAYQLQRESEVRYRTLFETMSQGVVYYDADLRIVRVNPAAEQILGFTAQDLLGQFVDEPQWRFIREDGSDFPAEEYPVRRALRSRQDVRDVVLGVIRSEPSAVRWIRADVVPQFRPGEASPFEFYTIFDDITAQRQLEQVRQAEHQQLEAILETMDEGVFAVRADGVVAVLNAMARQFFGVDDGVAIETYRDLEQRARTIPIGPDGQIITRDARPIARVLRGDRLRELEICIQSIGGSELRWLSCSGTPVYGLDGAISMGVVTMQDITSRKQDAVILQAHTEALSRNNAELTRVLQLKDAFLAMMSHELRTPLHIILGFSEALEEQIYGPISPEQRNALIQVSHSGRHLLAILADILDLAHIDAGAETLELQPIDVEDLCNSALQFVQWKAQQKSIHLLRTIQQGVSGLRADERRLTQILVNLLDNAVKFTPAGGKVGLEVTTDAVQGQIQFVVWDTGIGIARQDYERLFQPFSQIDIRLSREYGGVGLGLSLVRRLVDLHGGSVSVDSTPSQGSRFTVRLPWSSDDNTVPLGAEQVEARLPVPAWTQPLHVLIADDHEVTLQLYSELLQQQGCHVVTARNGEEALTKARLQHPDLAIIDIQMPVMDGLTAIQQMRADVALERLPIIALTALAMPGDQDRCLEAGADSYLAKPVSLQRLLETMSALIDSSGANSKALDF